MGRFSKDTKCRAWIATVQVANMEKLGMSKEEYEKPELLAEVLTELWNSSGINRISGVSICVSVNGLYHAHMALYGKTTTLNNVSKILGNSHVEPQMGGKKELAGYLLKEPPYDEKGELVLFSKGIDNIQDVQGKRSDLDEINELLEQGFTPREIMAEDFRYRKFEKMIKSAYIERRIRETPIIKDMHNEWHVGESGSGKTYYYCQLCEKYATDDIYMTTDFENGGFDFYIEQGAPPILFLDEFKWNTCIITSVFPPDEVYSFMVSTDKRDKDKIDQLLRRLDTIVYHYKQDEEYKTFSIPASEYSGYEDLRQRALGDRYVFEDTEKLPFDSD